MRLAFLDREMVNKMVNAGLLPEVVNLLERTGYGEDLSKEALGRKGADLIDLALGANMARTCRKLLRITPEEAKGTVSALFEKWDVYNLKTLLLAKHLGHEEKEIEPLLVPAGRFGQKELKRMLGKKNVEELVSLLRTTEYGPALSNLLPVYKKSGRVAPLLSALEMQFYKNITGKISSTYQDERVVRSLIKSDIDIHNIMNVLRSKRDRAGAEEIEALIIEGGNLRPDELRSLIEAKNVEEAISLIKGRYNLEPALAEYGSNNSLVPFEIMLERELVEKGLKAFLRSCLSVGVIVGFFYLKETEINNIRKILRAKEFEIPPDELKRSIIVVKGRGG